MEPVTHFLTGACLARTGLNRRVAYTTLAMTVGAEFPDIDTLWGLRGPVASFQHHRGITHTFLGLPFEAAAIVAAIYIVHWFRTKRGRITSNESLHRVLPHWGLLYVFTLLALLSHIFLDFTNNYGVRPFFPFNPHWYAASITFIFDPLMFLVLLAALVLPALFRLISSEVGARRRAFASRGWSATALLFLIALWTLRETQHARAVQLGESQSISVSLPTRGGVEAAVTDSQGMEAPPTPPPLLELEAQHVLANPDPLNPFRWWTVTDFGPAYQLGQADTLSGTLVPSQQPEPKALPSPSLLAAEASSLGRAYLDWSPMPFVRVVHPTTAQEATRYVPATHTLVSFRDPRFMGDIPLMRSRTPLEGIVELDEWNRVVAQTMDGREQH